ncbi:MAG: mechanosensitive ion channel family protein [Actinomycetes bacterium]|jgi:small-conductance mechanosensitive channel|nr:mechanosensitive ion channel family protein [Actinomycetes bacterium]
MGTFFDTFFGRYGVALLEFGAWLVVGLILQQIVNAILRQAAARRHSRTTQAFAAAFRGIIAWSGGLIGFWYAYTHSVALTTSQEAGARRWLVAATILIVTVFLARVIGRFITAYTARESTKIPSSSIFSNLVAVVVYIIGGVAILSTFHIQMTPILTALGVGGIAVGLALQSTLDNLFSGIQILASRQIEPGDYVRLESGEEGTVEDVTWRNTTIRRQTSELVIVPNSVLGKASVVNYSRNAHAFALLIPTTVAYGTDLETLKRVVMAAARETMDSSHYVYKEEEPAIIITANTDNGISFVTELPIIAYNFKAKVTSVFLAALQRELDAAGIKQPLKPLARS